MLFTVRNYKVSSIVFISVSTTKKKEEGKRIYTFPYNMYVIL